MKRALHPIVLGFALLTLACSSGEVTSAPDPRTSSESSESATPAIALEGRVTDAADVLTVEQRSSISSKLERFEQATKHQMVVVTAPTTGGRDIADFARDLGNSWGIGRKGYNDGVMILVAPNERKVRIAVGYGLEKRLTDRLCKQIIEQEMLPHFREGDFAGGIGAGTDALIAQLR